MLAISLEKLLRTPRAGETTLAGMGIKQLGNQRIAELILAQDMGSDEICDNPIITGRNKTSFAQALERVRKAGLLSDVIGSTMPRSHEINFSTLLSSQPKAYLEAYVRVFADIAEDVTDVRFHVWLEDSFTRLYRGWDGDQATQATSAYRKYFLEKTPGCRVTLSSESAVPGVPTSFLTGTLGEVTLDDFAQLLAFHKRATELISVLDLVHFAWNCYVVSRLPGMHMVGASTKRHFQMFRKLLGKSGPTVLLVPEQQE